MLTSIVNRRQKQVVKSIGATIADDGLSEIESGLPRFFCFPDGELDSFELFVDDAFADIQGTREVFDRHVDLDPVRHSPDVFEGFAKHLGLADHRFEIEPAFARVDEKLHGSDGFCDQGREIAPAFDKFVGIFSAVNPDDFAVHFLVEQGIEAGEGGVDPGLVHVETEENLGREPPEQVDVLFGKRRTADSHRIGKSRLVEFDGIRNSRALLFCSSSPPLMPMGNIPA